MRAIKFRVWEIPSKRYFYDLDSVFKNVSVIPSEVLSLNDECLIPEQFTGFTDKNGKKIYDGDILSDWTETDEGKVQSFYTVFWGEKKGQWRLDESLKQDRSAHWPLWSELKNYAFEITGNIHQNPELLTRNS